MSYIGAFLTVESRDRLLAWWQAAVPHTLHPSVFCHHMTVKFAPRSEDHASMHTGACVTLDVIGYGADKRGQAVVVSCRRLNSGNTIPHVTVAMNGERPVYSNTLLAHGWTSVTDGPVLVGVVGTTGGRNPLSEQTQARCVALDALLPASALPPNVSPATERPSSVAVSKKAEKSEIRPPADGDTATLMAWWSGATGLKNLPPPDVRLVIGQDGKLVVSAHRFVLASGSGLFQRELYGEGSAGDYSPPLPNDCGPAAALQALAALYKPPKLNAFLEFADAEYICAVWPFVGTWELRGVGAVLCKLYGCDIHFPWQKLLALYDVLQNHPSPMHVDEVAKELCAIEVELARFNMNTRDQPQPVLDLTHPAVAAAARRVVDDLVMQQTRTRLLELEGELDKEVANELGGKLDIDDNGDDSSMAFATRWANKLAPLMRVTRLGPIKDNGTESSALKLGVQLLDAAENGDGSIASPARELLLSHNRVLLHALMERGSVDDLRRIFAGPVELLVEDFQKALLVRAVPPPSGSRRTDFHHYDDHYDEFHY